MKDGKSNKYYFTTCIKKYDCNSNKTNTRLLFVHNRSFASTLEITTAAYPEYTEVSVMDIRYTSGRCGNVCLAVEHNVVAFSDLSVGEKGKLDKQQC